MTAPERFYPRGILRIAETVFRETAGRLTEMPRAVLALSGGSGAGKTTVAGLLAERFRQNGLKALVLAGDDFPRRVPSMNDAERLCRFRDAGMQALVREGLYGQDVQERLKALWRSGRDAEEKETRDDPWLRVYQEAGKDALRAYLGTPEEVDFGLMNRTVAAFRNGEKRLWLRHLGRGSEEMRYTEKDVSDTRLLIVEWAHAGSEALQGADVRVLLHAAPEQTEMNRLRRARDPGADSSFVRMVLRIEQEALLRQAARADLILDRNGDLLTAAEVCHE